MADDKELTEEEALEILEEYFEEEDENKETNHETDDETDSELEKIILKKKPVEKKPRKKKKKEKKPKDPNKPHNMHPRIKFLSEMMHQMKVDNSPIPQRQRMRYIHDLWAAQQAQAVQPTDSN